MMSAKSPPPSAHLSNSETEKQFLRLHLVDETIALLLTEKVTQVLTIGSDRVVPMPHMDSWLIGAYNYRGEILWLIDLGYLMGLKPLSQQAHSLANYQTVVLQVDCENSTSQLVGLVVNRVNSTEWCKSSLIKAPSSTQTSEFEKLIKGYWEKSAAEILAILDFDLIWQKIIGHS